MIVHLSWVLAVVPLAFIMVTLVQQKAGRDVTSFSPRSLAVGGYLVAGALTMPLILGYGGMFLAALLLLPLAVVFVCVAWVQPGDDRIIETVTLAVALPILLIWFSMRVDDYPPHALLSAGAIVAVLAALGVLRWRAKAARR